MAIDAFVDSTQLNSDLTSIANAIRAKGELPSSQKLSFPAGFISAISSIPHNSLGTHTFTENGIYNATDYNCDGLSQVTIKSHPGLLFPINFDITTGYVYGNLWKWGGTTVSHSDVFEVEANKLYYLFVGETTGTRFRSMFSPINPEDVPLEDRTNDNDIVGTQILRKDNPESYAGTKFTTTEAGYILIQKDNAGVAGLISFVIDISALESAFIDIFIQSQN